MKMSAKLTKIASYNKNGYTLIEISVVLTTIGKLFRFGFVSFRAFSRREALTGTLKKIQGDLRLAQAYAFSGQKPDDVKCNTPNTLDGYSFKVYSSTEYKIEGNCSGGTVEIKDVTYASDVVLSIPSVNPIMFKILGQGTNIPTGETSTFTLTQSGTNSELTVTVTSGGEIK